MPSIPPKQSRYAMAIAASIPYTLLCLTLTLLCSFLSTLANAASEPAVEAKHGMVVSSQHLASQVGVDILKQGGNAVDAAVAVGYAQAVVNPCCGNIGGGGFMLIHLASGKDTFINFREMAPAGASANMYLDNKGNVRPGASLYGWLAAGVPGTVMGLETARAKYGKLSREQDMAPAIRLAREGFILTRADTDILDTKSARFQQHPGIARIFLRPDGSPLQPGDRLVQKDLAKTLALISKEGTNGFYHGTIPAAVDAASRKGGGVLRAADFADYHTTESTPLQCNYRGYTFLSAPPPSSGGVTLCETLNILAGYDLKSMGFNSAAAVHTMTEAMRYAYADRNTYLGDPAFIHNPVQRLLSAQYAAEIRGKIKEDQATPSSQVKGGLGAQERPETTHYSIVDHDGNAVSTTYTINGFFGAVEMAPGTGFFLNDEMDDFTSKVGAKNLFGLVQGKANSIAPGKRPLSSMSPTLVTKDGKTYMVLGSPGGSRIITITLETALNIIDFGMAPQEAVNAPRFHHQWLPDEVDYEQHGISQDSLNLLTKMGYHMKEQTPWGAAELILVGLPGAAGVSDTESSGNDAAVSGKVLPGYLYGANDVRRPAGSALGY